MRVLIILIVITLCLRHNTNQLIMQTDENEETHQDTHHVKREELFRKVGIVFPPQTTNVCTQKIYATMFLFYSNRSNNKNVVLIVL